MSDPNVDIPPVDEGSGIAAAINPDQPEGSNLGPVTLDDFNQVEQPSWLRELQSHPAWFYTAIFLAFLSVLANVDGFLDLLDRLYALVVHH